jgi:CBS domain-containing protein
MPTPKTLDARVAGASSTLPAHPRVEPANLDSLLLRQPTKPTGIDIATPLFTALQRLEQARPAALLVMEDGRLRGIFTAADLVSALSHRGPQALERPVREAMTPCPFGAAPTDSLHHGLHLLDEHDQPFLPVLADGLPLGLLSRSELLAGIAAHYEKVFKALALDQQILFLRGTYSC